MFVILLKDWKKSCLLLFENNFEPIYSLRITMWTIVSYITSINLVEIEIGITTKMIRVP